MERDGMAGGAASIDWRDGVPMSTRFDDPYYALSDGLAESRHVFLAGNGLPDRFRDGFHIAELGFGTGLNALAAWEAWEVSGKSGPLRFTSFEAFPLQPSEMEAALAAWPELGSRAEAFLAAFDGRAADLPGLTLDVITGDARQTLPDWPGRADAWFLDGFSPAKNPELWEPELLSAVADHTAPGGTFATYSAAGHVRRGLHAAGFTVTRRPGFGHKRHMTSGTLR